MDNGTGHKNAIICYGDGKFEHVVGMMEIWACSWFDGHMDIDTFMWPVSKAKS